MFVVPALKVQQFTQEFFLLNLAAGDVERLVRFEVLGQTTIQGKAPRKPKSALVNWAEIESKVEANDEAYQRPIVRKKIEELASYYLQCRDDAQVPAVPGAVLLTTDEPVEFTAQDGNPFVGLLRLASDEAALRVLDGQHRLLALAALLSSPDLADVDRAAARALQVPAVLFVALPPPSVVEMFATINSKHTRLNPSLLFSLKGKQLYADPLDARVHDIVRRLNDADSSPLKGRIKMLGVGPGRVAQAGLAQELRRAIESVRAAPDTERWREDFEAHAPKLYLTYFREVARVFATVWDHKKHSTQSLIALRAFIQASIPVVHAIFERGGDPRETIGALLASWSTRPGPARFETAGAWRALAAGGGKETTRRLARELIDALAIPSRSGIGGAA